ncbi:MAG: hypothetical protein I8H94_01095 [Rhodobacteraceae bacterium]|nr:hypothetical protein [Paracoccaceae bacterium]
MRGQRPPLFLARAVYRRRRLRDAARLLPLMGVFLLLLPLLWSDGTAESAGQDWTYIFGIWAVLIALAAALAPGLAASDPEGAQDEAGEDR